jgi:hypothetical protein
MRNALDRQRAYFDMITNFTHVIQQVNSHNNATGNGTPADHQRRSARLPPAGALP